MLPPAVPELRRSRRARVLRLRDGLDREIGEHPGWYTLGIGVGEIAEGTAPTILALDNLAFAASIPEPGTLALLAIAAAAALLAARSARRAR